VERLALDNESASPTPKTEPIQDVQPSGMPPYCFLEFALSNMLASPGHTSSSTSKNPPGQESPIDFVVLKDADLANSSAATGPMQEDEPSAADYDPTMDMQEDKMRHDQHQRMDEVSSAAYNEAVADDQDVLLPDATSLNPPEGKLEDGFDMFAETDELDMFAENPPIPQQPKEEISRAVAIPQAKALDMSMLDDWDDPEGYYKVILGELLDNRYHVQSNLGKGMFSGVVRATDQKSKSLVAIKLIRNNETM